MNPFFDPKKFSDEELYQKIVVLHQKMLNAYHLNSGAVSQLRSLLDTCEVELTERRYKQTNDIIESRYPKIIETDPDCQIKPEKKKDKFDV